MAERQMLPRTLWESFRKISVADAKEALKATPRQSIVPGIVLAPLTLAIPVGNEQYGSFIVGILGTATFPAHQGAPVGFKFLSGKGKTRITEGKQRQDWRSIFLSTMVIERQGFEVQQSGTLPVVFALTCAEAYVKLITQTGEVADLPEHV
jgi:hypothetical protein